MSDGEEQEVIVEFEQMKAIRGAILTILAEQTHGSTFQIKKRALELILASQDENADDFSESRLAPKA